MHAFPWRKGSDEMTDMTNDTDEHIELTPAEARQGGVGKHLLTMLVISTIMAAVGLAAFFLTTAAVS